MICSFSEMMFVDFVRTDLYSYDFTKEKARIFTIFSLNPGFYHNYDLTGVDPDHLILHACARMTLEYGVKTHSRRKQLFWHRFLYINYLLKAQMFNAGPNPWRGIDEEACSVNLLSHLT